MPGWDDGKGSVAASISSWADDASTYFHASAPSLHVGSTEYANGVAPLTDSQ